MAIRAEYEVVELPQTYVTKEKHYSFEDVPNGRRNRWGELPQRMVEKEIEVRGGWLFKMRGKPGHSIRLTDLEQVKALKLAVRPRLVDVNTGEVVNEQGIPLSVVKQLEAAEQGTTNGVIDTDVDVNKANLDEALGDELPRDDAAGAESVATAIEKLE